MDQDMLQIMANQIKIDIDAALSFWFLKLHVNDAKIDQKDFSWLVAFMDLMNCLKQ